MPPWHIDKTVGIQDFKNDRSLTDEQIATLVNWVDDGTPLGNRGGPAAAGEVPRSEPLAIRRRSSARRTSSSVAVRHGRRGRRTSGSGPVTETGLTEARWVRAIEIKPVEPRARKIVHHVLTTLRAAGRRHHRARAQAHGVQRSAGLFMEWAVGKVGEIFPPMPAS